MAPPCFTRRQSLVTAASCLLPGFAALANAQADTPGAARKRPLAAQGLCLDVALAGKRLVAVGERGHVLLSDDAGVQWRQAAAVPTRNTLTALHAVDASTLWAVGHGGVMLKTADAGEHWRVVPSAAEPGDVWLSVRVGADGHGLAVGSFGAALRTGDGGATWQRETLVAGEAGERHLNKIFVVGSTWLIAAEGGHVMRSEDRGARWQAVKTPYAGSLWSGLALQGGGLLACGMRGNVVFSPDDGRSWVHRAVPGAGSFTGAAQRADGLVALVGVDGTLATSTDAGATLTLRTQQDRSTLTGALFLPSGELVASSVAGVRILKALA